MLELNHNELALVTGGLDLKTAIGASWQKPLDETHKRLILVYCLGQEVKKGVENLDLPRFLGAGVCLFSGLFVIEITKNLFSIPQSQKHDS